MNTSRHMYGRVEEVGFIDSPPLLSSSSPSFLCIFRLWRSLIPEEAPLEESIDFESLGRQYALAGGSIRNAVFRAATRAALRPMSDSNTSVITEADLHNEAKEEVGKLADDSAPAFLYG